MAARGWILERRLRWDFEEGWTQGPRRGLDAVFRRAVFVSNIHKIWYPQVQSDPVSGPNYLLEWCFCLKMGQMKSN